MAETQRLNTGRSSEFADQASGNGITLSFAEVTYTGGVEGFTSIADVTGVTTSFTLTVPGTVQFFGSGASLANPFIQGNYLGLAVNVNGTDYYGNGTGEQGFNAVGGGNLVVSGFTTGSPISFQKSLSLAAGSYTVKLRAFGNGYLESSSLFPTRLTVVYPTVTGDVATASPLTSQATGPFAATVNPPDSNYLVVGSSTVTVVLASTQTVVFAAYAHFIDPGTNSVSGNIGVRRTSPGPVTVDYDGSQARGGNDVNYAGSSLTRAVQLTAGTHTFDLIVRNPASGAQFEYANAFLTVVYTVPQVVSPVPFSQYATAVSTSGNFAVATGGTYMDVPGPLEISFNHSGGDALVEVQGLGVAFTDNKQSIGLGLKLDGAEQSGATWAIAEFAVGPGASNPTTYKGFGMVVCQGNGINANVGSVGFKYQLTGLSAGTHTIRLTAVSDGQGTGSGRIAASAVSPLRMSVWYN